MDLRVKDANSITLRYEKSLQNMVIKGGDARKEGSVSSSTPMCAGRQRVGMTATRKIVVFCIRMASRPQSLIKITLSIKKPCIMIDLFR